MPYTPDPTDATHPTTGEKASTAAAEFAALKGYIQSTILPLINGKIGTGTVLSATLQSSASEALRIENSGGYIAGFNTANNLRTGYLQFISAGATILEAENGAALQLIAGAKTLLFAADGSAIFPAGVIVDLGATGANRWNKVWSVAGSFSGDVTAATFHGDGSGLTGLPGGTITSGQIVSALGYTPYNAANPSSYISGINSGMVTAALGFTPYNASNPSNYITGINKSMVDTAVGVTTGSNAAGARTVSTSAPSGGSDGDIWLQV